MGSIMDLITAVAKYSMAVDMFPVFFFAHFAIGSIIVREDSKHLGPKFPQKHPFASWICTLLCSLSGVFVANFLFGDPLLDVLKENFLLGYFTIVWYLMNYSPFDIVYKAMKHPIGFVSASIVQECLRARFVYLGLQTAATVYPKAPLIIMMGGVIKGNGYGFIKIVERLCRGHWNPEVNEFLQVSYFAKSGLVASLLFLLHHYKLLHIPIELLYLGIVIAFITGRIALVVFGLSDPIAPLQAPFCRLLFGNWEAESSVESASRSRDEKSGVDENKNNKTNQGSKKRSKNIKKE